MFSRRNCNKTRRTLSRCAALLYRRCGYLSKVNTILKYYLSLTRRSVHATRANKWSLWTQKPGGLHTEPSCWFSTTQMIKCGIADDSCIETGRSGCTVGLLGFEGSWPGCLPTSTEFIRQDHRRGGRPILSGVVSRMCSDMSGHCILADKMVPICQILSLPPRSLATTHKAETDPQWCVILSKQEQNP